MLLYEIKDAQDVCETCRCDGCGYEVYSGERCTLDDYNANEYDGLYLCDYCLDSYTKELDESEVFA